MSNTFDSNAAQGILKERYTKLQIQTLSYQSATVGLMPKDEDGGGAAYNGSIRSAVTTCRSANDTIAYGTGGSPSTYNMWSIPWKSSYAAANISGEAIDKADGNENSLVDALIGEFDGAFVALGLDLGATLFGNGGGAIGVVDATPAGTTVQLRDISQVVNFQPGMVLQAATTDGTSGSVESGTVQLSKVDEMTGILTANANWTAGIATIAAGDSLFANGDFGAKFIGFSGWLPDANNRPTSALFFGVDRTASPVKLAGAYLDGGGSPKEETLVELAMYVGRTGGKPEYCVCNPVDYADLAKAMESRARIVTPEAYDAPTILFSGFQVSTPWGVMSIISDVFCPKGKFYLLQMNTWLLGSIGGMPKVLGEGVDKMTWLRQSGSDSYQMRAAYRAMLYCSAPGYNGVGLW